MRLRLRDLLRLRELPSPCGVCGSVGDIAGDAGFSAPFSRPPFARLSGLESRLEKLLDLLRTLLLNDSVVAACSRGD